MSQTQIKSKYDPIETRSIRALAIEVWRRAEGMGLVEANASSLDSAGITRLLQRVRDAGVENGVFPIHADARALPFPTEYFDAVVSVDSFPYYGTDDTYLNYLARFVRPGGAIGIAGAREEDPNSETREAVKDPTRRAVPTGIARLTP